MDKQGCSAEAETYKYKYNVTINNAEKVDVGDIGNNCNKKEQHAEGALDVKTKEQALIDCQNILTFADYQQPLVPVSLEISSKPVQVQEGQFHARKDFLKLYEHPPTSFTETEIFEHPKQEAKKEAEKLFKTDVEKEKYVARNGNIIGVVGHPGIGKTSSAKRWVKKILDGNIMTVSFVFLIFVRNINFAREMTLFELLVSTVVPDWKHSNKNDLIWLEKILKDQNVLIVLDGFDETPVKNLNIRAPKVTLYEKAAPLHLMLNLMSGNLLPFARILITSRPDQLYHLHADHRPKFIVQILGLNSQGQDELGRQICMERYDQIKTIMLRNPDAFAYCYVPVNFLLTVCYLMQCEKNIDFVCMTLVLSFACERYSCSDQLRGKKCNLDRLCKLAWNGYQKLQIYFEEADLMDANLDGHTIDSFLNTSVVKDTNIRITIMEGHKRSYFSHLTWQEFFAAMYLMLFASDKEFKQILSDLFNDRWEVVTKFLFGMCNKSVYQLLKRIAPCCSVDQWKKKTGELQKVAVTYLAEQYDQIREHDEKWQKLVQLCSWLCEAGDKEMAKAVATNFPDSITMCGTILPSDISNLFYVVQAADKCVILKVAGCNFTGDTLSQFWKKVVASNTKIQSFHLFKQKISDDDLSSIVESLQHVQKLTLGSCGVSTSLIAALAEKWEETKPQFMAADD